MSEGWARLEGQIVDGRFPLRRYLGCSDHSAVFLIGSAKLAPAEVALKLVQVGPAGVESQLARWRAVAELTHPHLVRIFDVGRCYVEGSGYLYVVMEYADQDLAQLLQRRALTEDEAREMLEPTLSALAFLHQNNLVVGQLKPSNVLVVGDQLKLASDAIRPASEVGDAQNLSVYDPPEARDGQASKAGDVWALGVMLCEALTRRQPIGLFSGPGGVVLPPDVPSSFSEVIAGCLRRQPRDRARLVDVGGWLTGEPVPPEAEVAELEDVSLELPALSLPIPPTAPATSGAPHGVIAPAPAGQDPAVPTAALDSELAAGLTAAPRASKSKPAPPPTARPEPAQKPAAAQPKQPPAPQAAQLPKQTAALQVAPAAKQTPAAEAVQPPKHTQAPQAAQATTLQAAQPPRQTPTPQAAQGQKPTVSQETSQRAKPAPLSEKPAAGPPPKPLHRAEPQPAERAPRAAPLSERLARPATVAAQSQAPRAAWSPRRAQWILGAILTIAVIWVAIHLLTTDSAPPPPPPVVDVTSADAPAAPAAESPTPAPPSASTGDSSTRSRPATKTNPAVPGAPSSAAKSASAKSAPAKSSPPNAAPANRSAPARDASVAAVHEVIPDVPARAKRSIRGTVRVSIRVIIEQDGSVFAALADQRGPSRYFERLALDAAKQWMFAPADSPGRRLMLVKFEFTRDGTTARAVPAK